MAKAERRAEAVWQGDLIHGHSKIASVGSGALGELPLTWASQFPMPYATTCRFT